MATRWEHFPHEANMGVRGFGASKSQAFEQAALALTAIMTDPAGVAAREAVDIECEAPDDELLLADWLNAVIYEMATRNMLFCRFAVDLGDRRLSARIWGEKVDSPRHRPSVEIKGGHLSWVSISSGWPE